MEQHGSTVTHLYVAPYVVALLYSYTLLSDFITLLLDYFASLLTTGATAHDTLPLLCTILALALSPALPLAFPLARRLSLITLLLPATSSSHDIPTALQHAARGACRIECLGGFNHD